MFRSNFGYGGYGFYPRGYMAAGIGYPYGALALPLYGYGYGYPGYGYGIGYPGYSYPYI